ncbi:MAG: type II secretion system protein GspM [Desulfobacterota bacterium]|nr:type II secretion system protein GspM [Thermodesulfobacteriota bacterium]
MKISFLQRKVRFSKRKSLYLLVGSVILFTLGATLLLSLREEMRRMEEETLVKKMTLAKYSQFLQNRRSIEEELDRTRKQYESLQQRLLDGETPQLAAAQLQEMVKKALDRNGMAIRGFRILEPKESPFYQRISIHIDFNPVNNLLSLVQFIHDIEHHEKALVISEMDLLVPNPRMPNQIQGSFVISGAIKTIKQEKTKGKGREG